ncbi:MAG: tol-pal system-associated acyl-CoA thioesterase [Steroidobacteraceae bacterium]|nr:tol-pal system-associated acyl-CoA thioesterase [Steroidobacteraceae bacterium]
MSRFSWPARVYWEDTDGGGVVYYANYLRFLERARTEWLRALGFSQTELAKEPGILFVVASLSIDYRRPARLDDALIITCDAEQEGAASIRFTQTIRRGDDVLVEANVLVACLDARTFRPTRLPRAIVEALRDSTAREGAPLT